MKFIITIDTEADNQWKGGESLSLKNIKHLPRFQDLCDRFAFPTTYLITYEVAEDEEAVKMLRQWQVEGRAEVGAHLHPWTTPPYYKRENRYLFLSELPNEILERQLENLTNKIRENFGRAPASFRGGRWSFDQRVKEKLIELGYLADCSFTPKVNWKKVIKKGNRQYAPDYKNTPVRPFYLDTNKRLLEVPMTILYTNFLIKEDWNIGLVMEFLPSFLRRPANKVLGLKWSRVYPETSCTDLQKVYKAARRNGLDVLILK